MFHPEYNGSQELQLPRPEILKNLFVNDRVLTEDNLSQYISLQKGIRFSFTDTRSQAELNELNAKFKELYIKAYAWAFYHNTKGEIEAYTTKYRLQKTEEERNEETFFGTQKKVKRSLKEAVKRNVNTIFRSNYSKLKSLTDDCAFVLSRLFEEYSYLKYEKIRNNIPDFIKRITSSNATCSTGEVDSGYVRQEIRGDLQKGIRFSFTDTRSYEEKAELNAKFKDLYIKAYAWAFYHNTKG